MYSLNMPVSKIRTKVRQQFEKHRYVKQLNAVDVLIAQSNMEFQVRVLELEALGRADTVTQETLNYWKQVTQVMKFFREEEDPNARLPKNFISGFLEVCCRFISLMPSLMCSSGKELMSRKSSFLYIARRQTPWRLCCANEIKRI